MNFVLGSTEREGLKNFENIFQWTLHRYTTMLMSVRHAFNEARDCISLGKNHLNSSPVALHFLTWKFQKAAGFSPLEVTLLKLILLPISHFALKQFIELSSGPTPWQLQVCKWFCMFLPSTVIPCFLTKFFWAGRFISNWGSLTLLFPPLTYTENINANAGSYGRLFFHN